MRRRPSSPGDGHPDGGDGPGTAAEGPDWAADQPAATLGGRGRQHRVIYQQQPVESHTNNKRGWNHGTVDQ